MSRDALTDLFMLRGVPTYIRSDNGPEFIAQAVRDPAPQLTQRAEPVLVAERFQVRQVRRARRTWTTLRKVHLRSISHNASWRAN